MWPFHKIVFLFDSSPECKSTLGQAVQLAEKCHSELVLFDTEAHPGKGSTASRVLEFARGGGADLIFIPRHDSGALEATIAGVLGKAQCPVWIAPARQAAEKDAASGPVLCAVEPGAGNEEHLVSAAGIAQAYGAKLHLIHAVPEVPEARLRLAAFERAMGWLMEFRRKLARTSEVAVHAGEVVKVLVRAAQTRGASLLVIGHGEAGGPPGHLGAHTYRIARDASCAVLVGAPAAAAGLPSENRKAA
ncbi:MAG TPA: universal stress protein [Bryobacteraceae bacterium]|jgi:nucleotide-binding universal stress UspA family protein|nr:universal stress protein [Bryobacteraceae bacterium]